MITEVEIGRILAGKYRVEGILGRGGMGVVVQAHHIQLDRRVALKFLSENPTLPDAVQRFLKEARAAARLQSEHVARVLDVGTLESGEPYMVMEHLVGSDLKRILKQSGPLSVDAAAGTILQVCDAVAEAHALGIVHRDLKPSNLFVAQRRDGSSIVKVLDFGISKALDAEGGTGEQKTSSSVLLGSPQYMSPEHLRNPRDVDQRTDIWALGTILHELLTGTRPFQADTVAALLATIVADPPRLLSHDRPGLPLELEGVVLRCLAKDRTERYPTVAALAQALEPFAPLEARPIVGRVARLLGNSVVPTLEVHHSSVPSEGTTAPFTSPAIDSFRPARRRAPILVGAALSVGVGALVWGAAVNQGEEPSPVSPPSSDAVVVAASPRTEMPQLQEASISPESETPATEPPASAETTPPAEPPARIQHPAPRKSKPSPPAKRRPPPRKSPSAGGPGKGKVVDPLSDLFDTPK